MPPGLRAEVVVGNTIVAHQHEVPVLIEGLVVPVARVADPGVTATAHLALLAITAHAAPGTDATARQESIVTDTAQQAATVRLAFDARKC